jgi:hypothetical protein
VTTLALELLKQAGVNLMFALPYLTNLEVALNLILDPVQRTAEAARAIAQLRDGEIPSIVVNLFASLEHAPESGELESTSASQEG